MRSSEFLQNPDYLAIGRDGCVIWFPWRGAELEAKVGSKGASFVAVIESPQLLDPLAGLEETILPWMRSPHKLPGVPVQCGPASVTVLRDDSRLTLNYIFIQKKRTLELVLSFQSPTLNRLSHGRGFQLGLEGRYEIEITVKEPRSWKPSFPDRIKVPNSKIEELSHRALHLHRRFAQLLNIN